MRGSIAIHGVVGLTLIGSGTTLRADIAGLQRVASGMEAPIFATHAPGDQSRLFIAQRGGQIRILDLTTGVLDPTPFLSTTVDTTGEGGLLGLAFHPNYSKEGMPGFGKFYVDVTTGSGSPFTIRVREFEVSASNPNLANAGSMREIISIPHTFATNHNGGWIGFSPNDNYLYIGTGDGGGGNDDGAGHTAGTGNAQDTTNNLLGKMLRIDVNGDDFVADSSRNYAIPPTNPFKAGVGVPGDDAGDDEIWAYGLRNPFRGSFDRTTGDLWIGDVGQSQREEIDFQSASSTGGANYGWRLREGLIATPTVGGPKPADNVDPVYDYDRNNDPFGGTVVTGGYVYRGPDPALQGKYFFLDSRNSAITADDNHWMFDPANPFGTVQNIDALLAPNVGTAQFPVSFGEDALGNLYITYLVSGEVYRIATTPATWNVPGSGSWHQNINWTSPASPSAIGTQAVLGQAITADSTVSISSDVTLGILNINNPTHSYEIAGTAALLMQTTLAAAFAQINVQAGQHEISVPLNIISDTRIDVAGRSSLVVNDLHMDAGRSITKVGGGTLTVAGPMSNSADASLFVNAGTANLNTDLGAGLTVATERPNLSVGLASGGLANVNMNASQSLDDLTVHPDATTNLAAGGDKIIIARRMVVDGILGMNNNDFIVDYDGASPELVLRNKVKAFADNPTTATSGISFTVGSGDRVIAIAENGEWDKPTFNGVTLDDTTIIGKYTYYGDSNLDGMVTGDDYLAVDTGLGIGNSWLEGDFNMDGQVTGDDYLAIDTNLGKGTVNPLAYAELKAEMIALHTTQFGESYVRALAIAQANGFAALVPEPAAAAMICAGGLVALQRRPNRRR